MSRTKLRGAGLAALSIVCALGLGLERGAAEDFQSSFANTPDRVWLGSDYHANRWQDWRIASARVECHETAKRLPMRTVDVLSVSLEPELGEIDLRVRLGVINHQAELASNAWGGLLIGAGGRDVDYRRTALVHHLPAEDGGTLVVVDGRGRVSIRSNENTVGGRSSWSLSGDVSFDALELFPNEKQTGEGEQLTADGIELLVAIRRTGATHSITARVVDGEGERVISTASANDVPIRNLEGSLGLVSHHGPKNAKTGWWFSSLRAEGNGVVRNPERVFGPILGTLYTVDDDTLKLTAQFPPLGEEDQWHAGLQIQSELKAYWTSVATAPIDRDSRTATFRIEPWTFDHDVPYRVIYTEHFLDGANRAASYSGIIRAEPNPEDGLVLGSLTCHKTYTGGLKWNKNGLWFPHNDIVTAMEKRDPDMLYFSGDQIYEGDLTPATQRSEDAFLLDYLWKYTHWLWAFGDLTRDRPTVVIPDDHDVYHGNIWGAGGRRAKRTPTMTAQDSGGYKLSPRFVNAVHRSQTAHLPDPVNPALIGAGYSVYYTSMNYGGVSFAIISDRQFKESPTVAVPAGIVKNGWFTAKNFDPAIDGDAPEAPLLGAAQELFLETWRTDWQPGVWTKVLLSQTPFACLQTLPRGMSGGSQPGLTVFDPGVYAEDDLPAADGDSNGWPQTARNRALSILQPVAYLHITGDQHLAYAARYGITQARDSAVVFCTPAIANTWPRRWMPRVDGEPKPLGDHRDGFGNLITVRAVANPHKRGFVPTRLHDRSPGFGVVRFEPARGEIEIVAWPRANGFDESIEPYEGWPLRWRANELTGASWPFVLNASQDAVAFSPPLDAQDAHFEIRSVPAGALVRTGRLSPQAGGDWRVPEKGAYDIQWVAPDGTVLQTTRVSATETPASQ